MSQPIKVLEEVLDEGVFTKEQGQFMIDFANRMNPNLYDSELKWIFEKAAEVFLGV